MVERKDWILIVLDCSKDKTLSPVQLQKSLFLLKYMNPDMFNNFYNFIAYHYGPFCLDIYEDADLLKFDEMININVNTIGGWNIYSINDKGIKYVDNLKNLFFVQRQLDNLGVMKPPSFCSLTSSWGDFNRKYIGIKTLNIETVGLWSGVKSPIAYNITLELEDMILGLTEDHVKAKKEADTADDTYRKNANDPLDAALKNM